jgi:hypothetical protein
MNNISSSTSLEHLPTGYVLVPVNLVTWAFLLQFALIDSTSGVVAPSSSSVPNNINNKNKKCNDSDYTSPFPSKKNKLIGNGGSSRSNTLIVIQPNAGRSCTNSAVTSSYVVVVVMRTTFPEDHLDLDFEEKGRMT